MTSHRKLSWKHWLAIVLATVVAIVVLQNTEMVETRLLFVSVSMPRAVLLFGALLVGFACGWLVKWRHPPRREASREDFDA